MTNAPVARSPDASSSWPPDVIESLVHAHERSLLAYASKMLGRDWQGAQDAVQETFLRLCREDRQKIESRVTAWLFTVCRSRVIDMQRTNRSTPTDTSEIPIADSTPDPAQEASDAEQQQHLAGMVDQLSPRQQEVLRLRIQAGLSYREIAEVTGLTVSNVGFHLHAAVRSLRDAMAVS